MPEILTITQINFTETLDALTEAQKRIETIQAEKLAVVLNDIFEAK